MADNPRDFDQDLVQFCDVCKSKQNGREHYCNDAMGIATPVLWNCYRCANPPVLVGWWRELKRRATNFYNRVHYRLTTTAEEREARRKHLEDLRARINARRAERGDPPIGG